MSALRTPYPITDAEPIDNPNYFVIEKQWKTLTPLKLRPLKQATDA